MKIMSTTAAAAPEGRPAPKRPRRQCVKCLDCGRTGTEARLQEGDPNNFVPKGGRCDSCGEPTFHRVDHDAVEYDGGSLFLFAGAIICKSINLLLGVTTVSF